MRELTRADMTQKFQTELEEAKEVARYELEQEHLENLRQLETSQIGRASCRERV